jgi:16S rRNA (adenine1518-N6/adenine1519-N6)-dimethyltransferase
VEIDKKLIPVLMQTLSDLPNVGLINQDILKLDFESLLGDEENIKIAANLPYYITTPVIMGFLESDIPFSHMTFLVQKEVGERLCAKPGTKAYGALSIAAQYYADISVEFNVPASVFMPRPKVDSVVISLSRKEKEGPEHRTDKKLFLKIVKAGFANRRKTLINSLSQNSGFPKEQLLSALDKAGIAPGIRAEKLTAGDFARLTDALLETVQEDQA